VNATKPLAVVTGASSGIGLELARQFAAHDYDLLVAAEDAGLEQAADRLRQEGAQVQAVQTDLTTFDGVERLARAIGATGRPVDAIAINAGVGVGGDFARETDLEAELELIQLNCSSTVHLAKRVLPQMVERGEGRVLFTSSIAGQMPAAFTAVYGASKAFVLSFSDAVREELKDTGVSVTALMPGPTETEFFERAGMEDTKLGQAKKDDPADVAREGFEAMMAGKDHVVAGSFKNRMQVAAATVLPDTVTSAAHGKMAEPGSGS
jgi:uncharacterized protein